MATNDYLSAAEIADIRARWECLAVAIGIDRSLTPDEEVAAEDDMRKLLAHLDARDALIATLRELLGEREWDFEDNGRESNSCRTCGVTLRHGDPMKHAPGCALDAALRGDQ